ncbi:MAG TPA: hypothetical protein VF610_02320 [Segetibacter sp.]|jgi:hypothetical protein
MKAKHTIILIALGFAIGYWGTLRKITHASDANTLLTIATILKVVGILGLAYKVISYEGFRKFMNK